MNNVLIVFNLSGRVGLHADAGSILTEMVKNQSIKECQGLAPEQFTIGLCGVPADKWHCPARAIVALCAAAQDNLKEQ